MNADALALLREIRDELRGLRADLARRGRGRGAQPDPAVSKLLRVIQETVQSHNFNTAELVTHAALAPDLQSAIVAVAGVANPRKLGKLLRRIEGCDFDGRSVRRVGPNRDGVIWTVAGLETRETRKPAAAIAVR